jgi:predicted transcriptional regulator
MFRLRRSKLETYIDILNVLARKGPLKLTHVMYKANVNCNVLKGDLGFLIKQDLIEERTIAGQHKVFSVTQRGVSVLNYFRQLTQILTVIE